MNGTGWSRAALGALAALWLAAPPARAATGLLGVNLDGVSDWSNPFFADLIKQGRPWNAIGSLSTPVPVDANGWPTGDAQ
ncbi:MAG TPA: hypothetical protein VLT47_15835, partial [Anaeromyxobacteraceae bacterium]|nr:hypothetical protein [Anaeromyxobacteraceae bacterium]